MRFRFITFVLALLLAERALAGGGKHPMPSYEGKYYIIYTDLDETQVREADLRMTRMVEEYQNRTREFAGGIHQKLPFYLFRKEQDYLDAGGLPDTAGIFDPGSQVLMAVAGDKATVKTWHVIQHEGFHQFAAAVIGGDLPIWVNEGLAEYFGEGIFTGDGFVTGILPDWRIRRIQKELQANQFHSIADIMHLSHSDWNDAMSIANYDQAWSMVHFLALGESGRYQKAFIGFMRDIGQHQQPDKAWESNFGSAAGFEEKWRKWIADLHEDATDGAYARATVQTFAGALGRAYLQKQNFDTVEAMEKAITSGTIRSDAHDWLPSSVFDVALENLSMLRSHGARFWIVRTPPRLPFVLSQLKSGERWAGQFTLRGNRLDQVTVTQPNASILAARAPGPTSASSPAPARPPRR